MTHRIHCITKSYNFYDDRFITLYIITCIVLNLASKGTLDVPLIDICDNSQSKVLLTYKSFALQQDTCKPKRQQRIYMDVLSNTLNITSFVITRVANRFSK